MWCWLRGTTFFFCVDQQFHWLRRQATYGTRKTVRQRCCVLSWDRLAGRAAPCDALQLKVDLNIYYKINILQYGDGPRRQDPMICLSKGSAESSLFRRGDGQDSRWESEWRRVVAVVLYKFSDADLRAISKRQYKTVVLRSLLHLSTLPDQEACFGNPVKTFCFRS